MTLSRRMILPLYAAAVTVSIWWLITTGFAHSQLLRAFAPQRAIPAVVDLAHGSVLWSDIGTSLWRLFVGLLSGGVVGLFVGLAVGSSASVEVATRPVFNFLRMVSPLSWAPMAIGLFGIGDRPVSLLIAAATVWPVLMSTASGVRGLDPGFVLVARTLGANRLEILTTVVLPAIRSQVLTGVRLALGMGWVVLVPAEMLGVTSGLGYEFLNSRDQLAYDHVMALILVIGALGYALDGAARWALRPAGARARPVYPETPVRQ